MANEIIKVPDIGGSENVDVIEVCVTPGDVVAEGDSIVVLESDKSSMEIPADKAGKVVAVLLKEGDTCSQGDALIEIEADGATEELAAEEAAPAPVEESVAETPAVESASAVVVSGEVIVPVPDLGGDSSADVIEVCVAVGDEIAEGDSLIVLESDKASMEVPSPSAGKVISITMKEGVKASVGDAILVLESSGPVATVVSDAAPVSETRAQKEMPVAATTVKSSRPQTSNELHPQLTSSDTVYAGPAVRKMARELGVDLIKVPSSGPKGRLNKDDVNAYVKSVMQGRSASPASTSVTEGSGIPPIPEVDFSQFGDIEMQKMSKIKKLTAANMSRNWLNVPHVTQFDDADITDLEKFRKGMKAEAEREGVKLTPLPFLLKACAAALKKEPSFNVSIHADGEHIVQKKYIHIGIAVCDACRPFCSRYS